MASRLQMAVGLMGNAASLLLYAAPILTFSNIIRKRSTQEYTCIPYVVALLNCLLYTWYGLPVVSKGWENIPLVTINGIGILFETSFIIIYFWFTAHKGKVNIAATVVSIILIFSITATISAFIFHDHHHRKIFVGSVALVASVAMYSAPLVVVKLVIQTKSVEFMPFHLSFFSFVASSLWMAYGLLGHDIFLAAPNLIGAPFGVLQLVIYCKYRNKGVTGQPNKCHLQKDEDEESNKVEIAIDNSANDNELRNLH